jgi:hypothetical protein
MLPLSTEAVLALHAAAIRLGLADRRGALLAGIDPSFVASLRISSIPADQLLSDLHALNDVRQLADGTEPLLQWAQNVIAVVGTGRDTAVFAQLLQRHGRASTSEETTPLLGPKTSAPSDPAAPDLLMRIEHWHGARPAQFAYFRTSDGLVKAYTALELRLNIAFFNGCADDLIVNRFLCRTMRYRPVAEERVVVQTKAKGLFTPEKLLFCPRPYSLTDVDVFRGKALHVRSREVELLRAKLSSKAQPGLYELLFFAEAMCAGRRVTFTSDIFSLFVANGREDAAQLQVWGKHYDDPVERLLDLPESLWRRISSPVVWPMLRYLGPLPSEILGRLPYPNAWTVREEVGAMGPGGGASFDGSNVSEVLTLPGPVNEHRYRVEDAIARADDLRALGLWPRQPSR